MLLEFEPTAGFFGSQCSNPTDDAIDAWFLYYFKNGGIGHRKYVHDEKQYQALKQKYHCAIYPAARALKLYTEKRKLRELKEAKALMSKKFEKIYGKGVKPMHPLLREFEASAGKKKEKLEEAKINLK